jgi:hypothetical protein
VNPPLAFAAALAATLALTAPCHAERQDCVQAEIVLWGDGRHDDTAALNAWLRGRPAIWAASGAPVGATIAGHSFRLSAALYAPGGSGRTLADFRLLWPERGEAVTGGTIRTGADAAAAPVVSGVAIVGGDAGEGKPLDLPDIAATRDDSASCATS